MKGKGQRAGERRALNSRVFSGFVAAPVHRQRSTARSSPLVFLGAPLPRTHRVVGYQPSPSDGCGYFRVREPLLFLLSAHCFLHDFAREHNALVPPRFFTVAVVVCVAFPCGRLQEVCEGLCRCAASADIPGFCAYRWCCSLWSVLALLVFLWRSWRPNLLHRLWTRKRPDKAHDSNCYDAAGSAANVGAHVGCRLLEHQCLCNMPLTPSSSSVCVCVYVPRTSLSLIYFLCLNGALLLCRLPLKPTHLHKPPSLHTQTHLHTFDMSVAPRSHVPQRTRASLRLCISLPTRSRDTTAC